MGVSEMKNLILLSCVIAIAVALPSPEDAVVPEEALFTSTQDAAWEQTRNELMEMRSRGTDDKDCRKLADDTESDVKASVKAQQDVIEAMDKGEKCGAKGQEEVATALAELQKATDDKKDKDGVLAKAQKKTINFGDFTFDTLTPGKCDTFFDMAVFKDAAAAVATAKADAEKAAGALTASKKAHEDAKKAAAKAANDCRCDVKDLHEKAIKKANADAEAKNKKAFKKAADLRCLLDGTPADKCKVTAIPVVKAVSLTKETEAATCGPTGAVVFSKFSGGVTSCGSNGCIYKTGSGTGWHSDATDKSQLLEEGGGGLCAYRQQGQHAMVGFDNQDSSSSYSDIRWAMYATSSNQYAAYENGANKQHFGANTWHQYRWACMWVREDNSKVEWWAQEYSGSKWKLWRTSAAAATFPLHVDAALYDTNFRFGQIKFISERPVAGKAYAPELM